MHASLTVCGLFRRRRRRPGQSRPTGGRVAYIYIFDKAHMKYYRSLLDVHVRVGVGGGPDLCALADRY